MKKTLIAILISATVCTTISIATGAEFDIYTPEQQEEIIKDITQEEQEEYIDFIIESIEEDVEKLAEEVEEPVPAPTPIITKTTIPTTITPLTPVPLTSNVKTIQTKLVKTGDNNIGLFLFLIAISGLFIVVFIMEWRDKNKKGN